jgi:NitT/TauT family transport system permease protein
MKRKDLKIENNFASFDQTKNALYLKSDEPNLEKKDNSKHRKPVFLHKLFSKKSESGKNKNTPRHKFLVSLKIKKITIISLQILILVGFFGLWELFSYLEWIDSFFMSSPSRVIKMLVILAEKENLLLHMGVTLLECIIGFAVSTALGLIIAILLWCSKTVQRVLEPYLVVLNSLPKIALGPMLIIWVGAGMKAIVFMAVLICVIVTIIGLLNGFLSVDEGKILLLRSMGAKKHQIFIKCVFPHSVPNLLSVIKINVGLAWVGTIMGEYLSSKAGLGWLITDGSTRMNMDKVMASILILCFLAAVMYLIVALIEKLLKRNR